MARNFLPADPLSGEAFINGAGLQFDRLLDNAHFWATVTSGGSEGDTVTVDINDNAVSPAQDTYFLSDGWQNGMGIQVAWPATNTGAVTVAANGGAALDVFDAEGNALTAGRLLAGLIVRMTYFNGDLYCTSAIAEGNSGPQARFFQTFNLFGTWTKPTGLSDDTTVTVQLWGAGGGGSTVGSVGGGGGAYATRQFRLGDLPSSVSVTVGGGGAAGSAGGNTTFGSLLTAYGGGGGGSSVAGYGGGSHEAGASGSGGAIGGGQADGADASTIWGGGAGKVGTGSAGRAVYGGGGGAGSGAAGSSINGGNGGAPGSPGNAPGGGGSANNVGGAGRCIVSI